jgi:hypothetical protein
MPTTNKDKQGREIWIPFALVAGTIFCSSSSEKIDSLLSPLHLNTRATTSTATNINTFRLILVVKIHLISFSRLEDLVAREEDAGGLGGVRELKLLLKDQIKLDLWKLVVR